MALSEAMMQWELEGLTNNTGVPNLGDVSVYGVLRAVQGLPVHDEIIAQGGDVIQEWYDRMKQETQT